MNIRMSLHIFVFALGKTSLNSYIFFDSVHELKNDRICKNRLSCYPIDNSVLKFLCTDLYLSMNSVFRLVSFVMGSQIHFL